MQDYVVLKALERIQATVTDTEVKLGIRIAALEHRLETETHENKKLQAVLWVLAQTVAGMAGIEPGELERRIADAHREIMGLKPQPTPPQEPTGPYR